MSNIHESSFVSPGAELDSNVTVGPFCYVGSNVRIGAGTILGPHVTIQGRTTIGENNHFVGQCAVGGLPQDLKYAGEESALIIGDETLFANSLRLILVRQRVHGLHLWATRT